MAGFTVYILRRDFIRRLDYPTATVVLETVRLVQPASGCLERWTFRARKVPKGPDSICVLAQSVHGRYQLEGWLYDEGFVVENGTPAALIMERLAREGCAISRPARNRDLK